MFLAMVAFKDKRFGTFHWTFAPPHGGMEPSVSIEMSVKGANMDNTNVKRIYIDDNLSYAEAMEVLGQYVKDGEVTGAQFEQARDQLRIRYRSEPDVPESVLQRSGNTAKIHKDDEKKPILRGTYLLKTVSIIILVYGIIVSISAFFTFDNLYGSFGNNAELILAIMLYFAIGIYYMVMGGLGMRHQYDTKSTKLLIIFGIIGTGFMLYSLVNSVIIGQTQFQPMIGVVTGVLYIIGAYFNKKSNDILSGELEQIGTEVEHEEQT
jgi:hypothetical protein